MSNYQPKENYDGQSFLKDWWGIVKENFGQIFGVFNAHTNGESDRHTASDIDCADGVTVQQCLNNEASARFTADTALGNRITTELFLKVDKEDGKGLSSCDFTQEEKEKLANLAGGGGDGLSLTNTTAYAPTSDYHPATKKYVDDSVADAGGGDMLRNVYDQDRTGVVDDAEKLGGQLPEYYASKEYVDAAVSVTDGGNCVGIDRIIADKIYNARFCELQNDFEFGIAIDLEMMQLNAGDECNIVFRVPAMPENFQLGPLLCVENAVINGTQITSPIGNEEFVQLPAEVQEGDYCLVHLKTPTFASVYMTSFEKITLASIMETTEGVNVGTEETYGILKITDSTACTEPGTAASAAALKALNDVLVALQKSGGGSGKIVTGSYYGTQTYPTSTDEEDIAANQNVIQFSSYPRLVIIRGTTDSHPMCNIIVPQDGEFTFTTSYSEGLCGGYCIGSVSNDYKLTWYADPASGGFYYNYDAEKEEIVLVERSNPSMQWSPQTQLNALNAIYCYVAICD